MLETHLSEHEAVPEVTDAERLTADLLSIDASPEDARRLLKEVPLWFHTFALNHDEQIYTPGIARDHRYRIPALPESFAGLRVLDIGALDGFYAFLAEARGAERVVAIDNEQYVSWMKARFGREIAGGDGFRAIAELLDSKVEYQERDALDLGGLDEQFDMIFCFGILHRVENPLGLLSAARTTLAEGGSLLVETYGSEQDSGAASIEVHERGDVHTSDDFFYWGFPAEGLRRLGVLAGFADFELIEAPTVDGLPRIIGTLTA